MYDFFCKFYKVNEDQMNQCTLFFLINAAHFSYNKFKQCDIVYLAGNNLFIEKVEVVVAMSDLSRSDLWKEKAERISVKAVFIL